MFNNIIKQIPFGTIGTIGIIGIKFYKTKQITHCESDGHNHNLNFNSNSNFSIKFKQQSLKSHEQYICSVGLDEAFKYIETNKLYGESIKNIFNNRKKNIFREFIKYSCYSDSVDFLTKWFNSNSYEDIDEWKYYFSMYFEDFNDEYIDDSIEKYFTYIDLETLLSNKNLTPLQLEKYFDNFSD